MLQTNLVVTPTSATDAGGRFVKKFFISQWGWTEPIRWNPRYSRSRPSPVAASATINGEQDHYAVLGVPASASSSDIKKAYRLLARKYHPDVSKDSRADELFKSIRLAYDVLSDDLSRTQFDRTLKLQQDTRRPFRGDWDLNHEFDDGVRIYRWADLRRKMQRERHGEKYTAREDDSFYDDQDEAVEEETAEEERASFIEVLRSALLSIFLMKTIGARLSLTFSSLMALLDRKLDAGYKMGYLVAWVLGGRGGVLLTLCLSFASWVCGKSSSSVVALVVVAMWVGSNLARYAPIPQGALLTLLYMSIKLQSDLKF